MPKINWTRLSSASRQHLLERLRERGITASDIFALMEWINHSPMAPEGEWFKDFGTFKLCGRGDTPLTFLNADQTAYGEEIEPIV
jgi:hypothetical protein